MTKNERRERKEKAGPGGVCGLWTVRDRGVVQCHRGPLRTDLKKKRVQRFERKDGNVQVAGLGVEQNETGDCPACLAWHPGPRSNFA